MTIQWTEDLAVGVADIDEQHRRLYEAVGALHRSMRAGSLVRLDETLATLKRYAAEHFATEERHMRAMAYPGLEAHLGAHRAFVERYGQFEAAFAEHGATPSLAVELSDWLGQWLREHVRQIDGAMGRHVAATGYRG